MTVPGAPSPFRVELVAVARLAGPLALANVLQMGVYAVDVIFIARLGAQELAAASLAVAVFGTMMWAFHGLTGGAAALIAAELGRGRHALREVRRTVRMAVWMSLACWALGTLVCLLAEALMLATGQDPAISAMAGDYILLLSLSIAPTVAAGVLRSFVAALGKPVFAMVITALAIAVNAAGNWVLIFGNLGAPALGLTGAALATILTAFVTFAAYAVAIQSDRRMRRYRLAGRWWKPEWARLRRISLLGAPIALTVIAEGGLFNAAAFLMGRIGTVELAAHTIALQIAAFAFQIPFGLSQAATIRVGYHFGAGDRLAAGRAGWAALACCLGFQMVASALMLFAPRWLLSAYVDPGTVVAAFAVQFLLVGAAFQLFDGVQAVAAGALRGLQDTRVPMWIALAGYWPVGFGLSFALGLYTPLAGVGVWIGLAAGLVVVACALLWRWRARERLGLVGPFSA